MKNGIIDKLSTYAALIGVIATIGGGFYAYKYVTSDNFEKLIKNKVMGDIQNVLPKAIQSEIPDTTGISIPF